MKISTALAPTWFGSSVAPKGVVVVAPAMGVRQDFYTEFAEFLATQGFLVGTIDYQDSGFNEPTSLRNSVVTFADWQADLDNLIGAAHDRAPNVPLYVCGHSLGGQLLGTLKNRDKVAAALTIASGTGYWGHNRQMTMKLLYLWYFAMPVYTRVFGYFPGRKMGKVGNLPRAIALTWSRWCRDPLYLMGDKAIKQNSGFDDVRIPILSLSFSDDSYIPRSAIDQLHSFYENASVERRHLVPKDIGEKRVGHFGFFKLGAEHTLWQQCAQWLANRQSSAGVAAR